jgi:hypothetical protein
MRTGWFAIAAVVAAGWLGAASAQAATVTQLNLTGGSINLQLQIDSAPPVTIGGNFTQPGTLIMGQYQPPPNIFNPIVLDGHSFSIFTHPGPDLGNPLPVPTGETVGNTINVNLHGLFASIAGPFLNGALNIGTQAPNLATGSYNPTTGAFEISWVHLYSPAVQFMTTAEFTLEGTAQTAPVPAPAAALLFATGLAGLGGLARRCRSV